MTPQENKPNAEQNPGQQGGYNPNIGQGSQDHYNPKREANQQNKNESTGLTEEEDLEGIDEESEENLGSFEDEDDSGAV